MTTSNHECLRDETTEAQNHWQIYKHCERIWVKQMDKAIETVYYVELEDPEEGLKITNTRTF